MAFTLVVKNTAQAGKVPTAGQLERGELAINLVDQKLYSKNTSDQIFEIGVAGETPSGGTDDRPAGPSVGDLYYDIDLGDLLVWDGAEWVPVGQEAVALNDLTDVDTTSDLADGTVLGYDGSVWKPVNPASLSVDVDLGYTPDGDNAGLVTNTAGDDATIPVATDSVAGLFTGAEKQKLTGIEAGAQVNAQAGRALSYDTGTDPDTLNADIATDATLGVVSIGDGIDVTADGAISVNVPPGTIISETAPDPAEAGQLWWADTDVDEGGGRLYIYTGDEWVDTSLPGAGSYLTADQADDLYLSSTVDDVAQGAITFAEQTTHENGIRVTSGEVLCQTDGVDGFVSVQPSGISTGKAYSTELGLSRERVFIARSGGIINSELYADPTEDGSTNGKWLNVIAANYYNSGGLTVSPSGQRPAAITANSIFQNDFDSTKTGNDLTKYGFLSKTNCNYSQKDLDPNVPDDAKKIATATGFGAWNNGKVKNYRAFEFLNGGSTGINNIGFYSQLDIKNDADNYSNYHGGTAPNFFQGLTEHASGVRVTGGDETTIQRGIGITSDDRLALINDNKAIATFGKDGLTYGMYLNSDLQLTQTGSDPHVIQVDYYGTGHVNTAELAIYSGVCKADAGCNVNLFLAGQGGTYPQTTAGITVAGFNSSVTPDVVTGAGSKAYNFFASGTAPNYFRGNIECDGTVNGAFSLRMQSDNPAAFQTTYSADSEGNQVENQEYIGTSEDLLSIIKDLRASKTALEARVATLEQAVISSLS